MKVLSVSIQPPRKSNLLANASVVLESEGETLKISDIRIIRNKQDVVWVAWPSYSVQQGRAWEYFLSVEPDSALGKRISDAVLEEFSKWQAGGER
jgi:SpoVG